MTRYKALTFALYAFLLALSAAIPGAASGGESIEARPSAVEIRSGAYEPRARAAELTQDDLHDFRGS